MPPSQVQLAKPDQLMAIVEPAELLSALQRPAVESVNELSAGFPFSSSINELSASFSLFFYQLQSTN